jgi:adenylylsulfate kinase
MKVLIMGLPGSGKTYLASRLAQRLKGIHLNADRVRETLSKDLGFSHEDRIEQARRMGCMAQLIKENGVVAFADFVCPTPETREAFGANFTIWMDTIKEGRFEDTNKLFVPPEADMIVHDIEYDIEQLSLDLMHCLLRIES